MRTRMTILAAVAVLAIGAPAQADYLAVYGGPTYDSSTQTGYRPAQIAAAPGQGVNDAGTAIGYANMYVSLSDKGERAIRWDASSTTVLGHIGTDGSGSTGAYAYALNASGTAVGSAQWYDGGGVYRGDRAVRWDAGGSAATELDNLGADALGNTIAGAWAIDPSGTAFGFAFKYESGLSKGPRPVRWDAAGTALTELDILGTHTSGSSDARAVGVNATGTAVGYAAKYDAGAFKGTRAVRWDAGGTAVTELGHIGDNGSGSTDAHGSAINDAGTVVGNARKYDGGSQKGLRAVRWDAGGTTATELDNLGTDGSGMTDSQAWAVNAAGTAVGYADKYDAGVEKGQRAVRWDAGGTAATELGNLGTDASGETFTWAWGINASGTAVGYAEKFDGGGSLVGDRAVYWGADGLAVDLNTLIDPGSGWTLTDAVAISDTGWITGIGTFDPDGPGGLAPYERLFLVQIPEPGTLALLALGAGGVAAWRRKRRSA